MIVKYTYLLNLKYKQLLSRSGYHAYYYIIVKKFATIHLFLQSLRVQKIEFLYVKHTRYLWASQFLKYFIGGPYIIVNLKDTLVYLNSDYIGLKLVALSLNNYFFNPAYLYNWAYFQTWIIFGTSNFISLMLIFNFWKSRLQFICYLLVWQICHQVRWLQKKFTSSHDR